MLKKVPKVAVLLSICSDLGRDSVCSKEMHSAFVAFFDLIPRQQEEVEQQQKQQSSF